MTTPADISRQLLRRLADLVFDDAVARWAEDRLKELVGGGPTFGLDEDSMADVLKRCALAGNPGFGLSREDLRWLLLRLASIPGPLEDPLPKGRYLACRRFGKLLPAGSGIVSACMRCGAQIVLPASRIPMLRDCDGALLCWRCAQTFPGRVVDL